MTTTARKPTRQQAAIANELSTTGDSTSAQDLHARLRAGGSTVGLATVYRACSSGHHHHLVCRQYGRTVEIEGPAVEQ